MLIGVGWWFLFGAVKILKRQPIPSSNIRFRLRPIQLTRILGNRYPIPIAGWKMITRPKLPPGSLLKMKLLLVTWKKSHIKKRFGLVWKNFGIMKKYGAPFKGGDHYFFYKNDGLQNQDVLYYQKGLDGTPEVFIDPNTLSADGTVAISQATPSNDGKYLAFQVSSSGSDWKEIQVMEIESRSLLSDRTNWVKFSGIAWYQDGFYYGRFDEPTQGDELKSANTFHKIYYHKLRTDQSEDRLVFSNNEDAERTFFGQVTEDERFLIISGAKGTSGNSVNLTDLANPGNSFVVAVDHFENDHYLVGSEGDYLYYQTNLGAPNQRLVKFTIDNAPIDQWQEVIPESQNVLSASMVSGKNFRQLFGGRKD